MALNMKSIFNNNFNKNQKQVLIWGLVLTTALALGLVWLSSLDWSNIAIVVGTELETNGHVEYLCLGRTCENVR